MAYVVALTMVDRPITYYKNQGITEGSARGVAEYLIHAPDKERDYYFHAMMSGGATACNISKVQKAFVEQLAVVASVQEFKIRMKQTLVIDADGRLH